MAPPEAAILKKVLFILKHSAGMCYFQEGTKYSDITNKIGFLYFFQLLSYFSNEANIELLVPYITQNVTYMQMYFFFGF